MSSTPDRPGDHAYFQAIEETFIRLRGAPLLLSPADWQLASRWRQEGVPLALVLETLEEVFAARQARGAHDRIQGLRYCRSAVEAAWQAHKEMAATGLRPTPAAVDVAARLREIERSIRQYSVVPASIGDRIAELAGDPEEVESELVGLDREALKAARSRLSDEELEDLEASVNKTIEPLMARLPAEELAKVRARLTREAVRRHFGLPVLSLFPTTSE